MASTIKVTNIDTPDGTGSITIDRPTVLQAGDIITADIADNAITLAKMAGGVDGNIISYDASGDPVAVVTGSSGQVLTSAGAGAPPTFAAAAGGGDTRNFIIDGDFTQWPEGTAARTAVNSQYSSALLGTELSSTGSYTTEQSTSVPTIAESGHLSQFSVLAKCTGTDASPGVGEHNDLRYYITGTDFKPLHQQQVTISFWCKTAAANSGDTYTLALFNNSVARSYVTDFTATSSWTKITKTITLDTSGTWTIADTTVGLVVCITLQTGSTYQGTADSWETAWDLGTSSTSNFMDSTSNEFYISQLQLVLGSTSPNFLGESIATVKSQVGYYVQKHGGDTTQTIIAMAHFNTTTNAAAAFFFSPEMRGPPAITAVGADGSWDIQNVNTVDAMNATPTFAGQSRTGCTIAVNTGGSWTAGGAGIFRSKATTNYMIVDARH